MRSMTGQGAASGESAALRVEVRITSVNHRFLDLALRLPDPLKTMEPELRALLAARLARGRVELAIDAGALAGAPTAISIDRDAARALGEAARELAELGLAVPALRFGDLLRLGSVVQFDGGFGVLGEAEMALVRSLLEEALARLLESREREGARLAEGIASRLQRLRELTAELAARRPELRAARLADLRRRTAELLEGREVDEERLLQELALATERSDVAEELDRLAAHLAHGEELLGGGEPAGKRLDFLCQEIHRELSTLGAKCREPWVARQVIEAKLVCEQLREQAQNIE